MGASCTCILWPPDFLSSERADCQQLIQGAWHGPFGLMKALKPASMLLQRKSRRLVAKAEKQAESRQFEDETVFDSNSQPGACCLLQSCSAEDVSLLASQACPFSSHDE